LLRLSDNERNILSLALFDASVPAAKIARQLDISASTVSGVLARMRERGIIFPVMRVDVKQSGGDIFILLASLTLLGMAAAEQIKNYFRGSKLITYAVEICGVYDYYIEVTAASENDVEMMVAQIIDLFGNVFSRTTVLRTRYMYAFERKYLAEKVSANSSRFVVYGEPSIIQKYDELDCRIVSAMEAAPMVSVRELAARLGVAFQSLHYRIKRLTENKVLLGAAYFLSPHLIGVTSYFLLLKVAYHSSGAEIHLRNYCYKSAHVIELGRRSGEWDFILDVEVSSPIELQQVRADIVRVLDSSLLEISIHVFSQYIVR
jgi:DNA-binding Lrp family transcriptional regulator